MLKKSQNPSYTDVRLHKAWSAFENYTAGTLFRRSINKVPIKKTPGVPDFFQIWNISCSII
jgi:hypothetical protein